MTTDIVAQPTDHDCIDYSQDGRCQLCEATYRAALLAPSDRPDAAYHRADVARLETALEALRGTGGRQRERLEVWLAGARVALAIAEREVR